MPRLTDHCRILTTLFMVLCVTSIATADQKQETKADSNLPRVLIIGDSISIGYTKPTI